MNTKKSLTAILIVGFSASLISAIMKILHVENSDTLMVIGVIAGLVFLVIALPEIWKSAKINKNEKIM
jgi:hypothetical protein